MVACLTWQLAIGIRVHLRCIVDVHSLHLDYVVFNTSKLTLNKQVVLSCPPVLSNLLSRRAVATTTSVQTSRYRLAARQGSNDLIVHPVSPSLPLECAGLHTILRQHNVKVTTRGLQRRDPIRLNRVNNRLTRCKARQVCRVLPQWTVIVR